MKQYAVFFSNELFERQREGSKRFGKENYIIHYRLFLNSYKQPVDELVLVTEAKHIEEDADLDNFLDEFYKDPYNSSKKFLGVGYWASTKPM